MAVKGLTPQLAERGKIKIGERGEMKTSQGGKQFAQPRKLDHFLITTMQRDAAGRLMPDAALMARLKPEGGKITEIPVRLLYDDIDLNFQTRYACYRGNRCWCSGDGEVAQRLAGENGKYQEVTCPCERQDPFYTGQDRCKILGTLQVLIEGTDRIGGVWKFRTTSWNTVNAILSSLALIKTITGGPLAGIPLHLVLSPKTVTVPTTGQNMVVFVVSLEFRGPESQLAELGYDIARRRVEHLVKMEHIEAEARRLFLPPQSEPLQEQEETAQEFYPEGAVIETTAKPQPQAEGGPVQGGSEKVHPFLAGETQKQEEKQATPLKVTFPELMELVMRGNEEAAGLPIDVISNRPGGIVLAQVTGLSKDEAGQSVYSILQVDFREDLPEIADGLTADDVIRAFREAGVEIITSGSSDLPGTVRAELDTGQAKEVTTPKGKGKKHLQPVEKAEPPASLF
jgi:hypothetical protein